MAESYRELINGHRYAAGSANAKASREVHWPPGAKEDLEAMNYKMEYFAHSIMDGGFGRMAEMQYYNYYHEQSKTEWDRYLEYLFNEGFTVMFDTEGRDRLIEMRHNGNVLCVALRNEELYRITAEGLKRKIENMKAVMELLDEEEKNAD